MAGGLVSVLLVGGTGHFGLKVARALTALPEVSLRLLVRPGRNLDELSGLRDRMATVMERDLMDERSLEEALDGVHTVISTVGGGPEVLLDGQLRLLRAAKRAGVRRFFLSDYGPDFSTLEGGEHPLLDARRRLGREVEASGVPFSSVVVGGFMEAVFSRRAGLFDLSSGRAVRWGSGEELLDLTAMEDAAHLVAAVALDPRAENQRVEFASDVMSFNDLVVLAEEVSGRRLEVMEGGPYETWRARMAEGTIDPVLAQSPAVQLWGMGHLHRRANSSYPQVPTHRVRQFIRLQWTLGAPVVQAVP